VISACGVPFALAQDNQLPLRSIQSATSSLLREIQAPATPPGLVTSPWKAAAPCPQPIARYGFVQVGEDMYVISGITNNFVIVNSVWRYNTTTNVWTSLADIPVASYMPAAAYLDGKIYVADGYYGKNRMRIYDIATNTWATGSHRPQDHASSSSGAAAGAFDGKVYLIGGGSSVFSLSKVSIYNVANDTWSEGPALPGGRMYFGGGSVQLGQFLYVVGGYAYYTAIGGGVYNSDFTGRLDMATNTWSSGPNFTPVRADFALAAIDNKLFAIGGDQSYGGYDDAVGEVNELEISAWPDGTWKPSPTNLPSGRTGTRAGFVTAGPARGTIWTIGGLITPGSLYDCTGENLFRAQFIANGGSSIISAGPNGALDPGETVTISVGLKHIGSSSTCTTAGLSATLLAGGGVINPPPAQNYGVLCGGDQPIFRNFTFTVDPNLPCGRSVTPSLLVTDGDTSYVFTDTFPTDGNLVVIFAENFDGVTAPALPAGWVTSSYSGNGLWTTSSIDSDTAPNNASVDYSSIRDHKFLETAAIPITSDYAKLSFRHSYNFNLHDFGSLFLFASNAPGHTVGFWTDNSKGYITSNLTLGPNLNGGTIKLQFEVSLDPGIGTAWRIDTLSISAPVCEGGAAPRVVRAVSRKAHGSAGAFDIDLPLALLDENIGIENRNGPVVGKHQIVVTFANPVTIGTASVMTGVGSVASSSVNGAVVTINLAGVKDAQRLGVAISNVNDGQRTGSVMIPMGVLSADPNGDRNVNSYDLYLIKLELGHSVTASNFRDDLDANGTINATDVSVVKLKSGAALP
jgi:Kelch motif protein/dockerin type I repeat protein